MSSLLNWWHGVAAFEYMIPVVPMTPTGSARRIGAASNFGAFARSPTGLASFNAQLLLLNQSELLPINPATGSYVGSGRVRFRERFGDGSMSATFTGSMYGIEPHEGALYLLRDDGSFRGTIFAVDPSTGVLSRTRVDQRSFNGNPRGLASHLGVLYAISAGGELFTANLTTGVVTSIGFFGRFLSAAMALGTYEDVLYTIAAQSAHQFGGASLGLYPLDVATGRAGVKIGSAVNFGLDLGSGGAITPSALGEHAGGFYMAAYTSIRSVDNYALYEMITAGPPAPPLPDATAPTRLAITDFTTIRDDQTATLIATPFGGRYDIAEYAWTIEAGGGTLDRSNSHRVVYTPPDGVAANTRVTIRCVATVRGTGTHAKDGTSATIRADETFTVGRPDAVAPSLSITDITSIRESATASFLATVSGGLYDAIEYAWTIEVGGGSLDRATGRATTYTPAHIETGAGDTDVTIRCVATVRGDDTTAKDGTTDTVMVEEFFTVTDHVDATVPRLAITDIDTVYKGQTARVIVTPSGGVYDTIAYVWEILAGSGTLDRADGRIVVYDPGGIVEDEPVRLRCTVTVRGTGTNADEDTSAMVMIDESFMASVMLPPAQAPGAGINGPSSGGGEFTIGVGGGVYDTISYQWSWPAGLFRLIAGGGQQTSITLAQRGGAGHTGTITCRVDVRGTGVRAQAGTTDSVTASHDVVTA